jgi:HK97 gp10 family phage protein
VSVEIDVKEIYRFASDLENVAPKQMKNAVRTVVRAERNAVRSRIRANAPKDRPWLAGSWRVSMRTYGDAIVGSVYSTPDPEGRMVAVFVIYGTSKMPPQDFLTPAVTPAEASFPPAVLAAIDPLSGSAGSDGGGDD